MRPGGMRLEYFALAYYSHYYKVPILRQMRAHKLFGY